MEKEQLILHSAQEFNILPLTSFCDAKCVFCSHRSNPREVRVVTIPPRTIAEVERTLAFLDRHKKITIGESATSIIEGEPFTHPRFFQVLKLIREYYPKTLIALTTNGQRINKESIRVFKETAPVEINVSLNSATVKGRSLLMGDNDCLAEQAIKSIKLLRDAGIPFHGSIVAMPHLVGWHDLEETISYLSDNGALSIRIFMAGYAKTVDPWLKFDPERMHQELAEFVSELGNNVPCPLLLEPPRMDDLNPIAAGVIKGSRADKAGMKKGDLICSVNGRKPRSRVEAWHYSQQPGNIIVQIKRQGQIKELTWQNCNKEESSGLVMEYDFDLKRMEKIESRIKMYSGPVLFLCSKLGEEMVKAAWHAEKRPDVKIEFQQVKNNFFGGSIGAAGLLTVDDFYSAYLRFREMKGIPELILVPEEAFDYMNRDLTGKSLEQLIEKAGVKILAV
ncbi:MAG: DUF512 domain-containing protein [Dehalobacterium sp.]